MRDSFNVYKIWCEQIKSDEKLFSELKSCEDNSQEIDDRFYKDLEFGTGGLRGVLGAGTNRMNVYTIGKATKGLAKYLSSTENASCAIAYDSRNMSYEFAKTAAEVLVNHGIKVYIYKELMPTPMLSFAVRDLKCDAGIVITASHNPAKYNGYKVYGSDGCQITLEAADKILSLIEKEEVFPLELGNYERYISENKIEIISKKTEDKYLEALKKESVELPKVPLKVVYSPLNGAGNKPVRRILDEMGNVEVIIVKEQELPDGNFPTCTYPNPEIKETMKLATDLLIETNSDFAIATDPDCDRVGVAVLDKNNDVQLINGNEMGCLLFDFICQKRIEKDTMPNNPIAVKTIVTTEMAKAIADKYGVKLINVLTGFKFIGEQIFQLEEKNESNRYIFGFEESYGYLSGTYVRDKDAVNAVMLICEMVAFYKEKNMNLIEALLFLNEKYGFYKSELLTFDFEGQSGMKQMNDIIDKIRNERPNEFANYSVERFVDYQNDETNLPKSNVIELSLQGDNKVLIRPSGTEPKLKIYLTAFNKDENTANEILMHLQNKCNDIITVQ